MSRSATISFDWAGETRRFRLSIGPLRDLQESVKAGPPVILGRLMSETWMVDDIRETIRLGLIGGGMTPDGALALVRRYVEDRPLKENVIPARAILTAALYGVEDEPVGKPLPAKRNRKKAPASSASPASTAPAS